MRKKVVVKKMSVKKMPMPIPRKAKDITIDGFNPKDVNVIEKRPSSSIMKKSGKTPTAKKSK
jgi:hypothetical protein